MSQTLDAVLAKGQTMPEKNRFPAVLTPYTASSFAQYAEGVGTVRASGGDLGGGSETLLTEPVPFRKSKRACSTTDNETWVPADASNTLNNFDLGDTRTTHAVVQPSVYENHAQDSRVTGPLEVAPTVAAKFGTGGGNVPLVGAMAVRRLTPNECYRLQGFPDNWGNIPWKGKPEGQAPDGPQYKAAGNSMAVPCMFWIGSRISEVHNRLYGENSGADKGSQASADGSKEAPRS